MYSQFDLNQMKSYCKMTLSLIINDLLYKNKFGAETNVQTVLKLMFWWQRRTGRGLAFATVV